MNPLQQTVAMVVVALVGTAALGCLVRDRARVWWTFFLYLLMMFATEAAIVMWPDVCHTMLFYWQKESVIAALRLAFAAEVGLRTMRSFPGAMATARRLVLLVLFVTLVAVATTPEANTPTVDDAYLRFLLHIQPRVLNGSVWMLIAIGGAILWYRLPVEPLHKAVLVSYIPYLLVFSVVLQSLAEQRFAKSNAVQYVHQFAYLALVAYWNYAIWRRDPPVKLRPGAGQPPPAGTGAA